MDHEALFHLPFLAGVPKDHLRKDLPLLQPFEVGAGEVLIEQGEVDDAMLIVVSGMVHVEVGQPALVVAEARAGEILGETALFRPAWRREATLRTATRCQLVVLGGAAIHALRAAASPTLAALERHALQSIARRLRRVAMNAPPQVLQAAPNSGDDGLWSRLSSWLWGERPRSNAGRPPDAFAVLRRHLPDLPEAVARSWADAVRAVPLHAEQPIASPAESQPPLRILAEGHVELRDRSGGPGVQSVLGRLSAGELIDPICLVHGNVSQVEPVAVGSGWVLSMPRETVDWWLKAPGAEGQALRRLLYEALFADLVARNTAWHARWQSQAA